MLTLKTIASALGGDICGNQVLCPGPGHSPRDRSLAIRITPDAPEGFLTYSHAGDDWQTCRDHVRARLGINGASAYERPERPRPAPIKDKAEQHRKAAWQWAHSRPRAGSSVETYLRQAREITCPLPPTLKYLPPRKPGHHPAMIAPFMTYSEGEPGTFGAPHATVDSVHLTLLRADGSDKADIKPNKITVGSPHGKPIVISMWKTPSRS